MKKTFIYPCNCWEGEIYIYDYVVFEYACTYVNMFCIFRMHMCLSLTKKTEIPPATARKALHLGRASFGGLVEKL